MLAHPDTFNQGLLLVYMFAQTVCQIPIQPVLAN